MTIMPADTDPPRAGFADAVEAGDIDNMVALLTDDARLTIPGSVRVSRPAGDRRVLREREDRRSAPLRLITTEQTGSRPSAATWPQPYRRRSPTRSRSST
jgi:hypothetical protein